MIGEEICDVVSGMQQLYKDNELFSSINAMYNVQHKYLVMMFKNASRVNAVYDMTDDIMMEH